MSRVISDFRTPFLSVQPGRRLKRSVGSVRTDFFDCITGSLRKASLGLFFGVAPKAPRGRIDKKAEADAETKLAKNIYQSMLDITGH